MTSHDLQEALLHYQTKRERLGLLVNMLTIFTTLNKEFALRDSLLTEVKKMAEAEVTPETKKLELA